jgi:hypothetical protein
MARQTFEHSYAGKTPQEIFEATRKTIDEIAGKYSLKHDVDTGRLQGKVARTGVSGSYRVAGERLALELDFSMLVPGAIRQRVADEVQGRLAKLFAAPA